jgi:hypothetical protein
MIGSIRKHSKWLWWLIAGLTIFSFVAFMGSGPARNGRGGGAGGSYGTIYGHELTAAEVNQAQRDFYLYFLINYGEWPDKARNINPTQIDQQTYLNLMFAQKAKALGIAVTDEVVADAASQMLRQPALTRALGTGGQPVPMDKFADQILKARGFTVADFQHSVRQQLIVEQLRMALGLSGAFVTPQEAGALYDREHQEVSAQAVFFSATNYLSQVSATPAAVGQFFTNYMAYYRVPERVQVNYVWFNITNYLAQSKAEWAKTNFDKTVDSVYQQYGSTEFKDAKTPEEAKEKIRALLIQRRALSDTAEVARDFVKDLFAMDPVKLDNIITAAKKKNLTIKTSAPFALNGNSEDFANAPNVLKAAAALNTDSPFSDMIAGEDGIYVIGLAAQLPSSVPTFAEIKSRVEQDFKTQSALALANQAGTNFYVTASVQTAAGQTFAQAAVAAGHTPVVLTPFSLNSSEVPEAGDHAQIGELKQAAFTTAPGHISRFTPTADGGFVLFVQKLNAPDATKKSADLTGFISQVRRGRENEAFNIWVNSEAGRELRNIPAFQKTSAAN